MNQETLDTLHFARKSYSHTAEFQDAWVRSLQNEHQKIHVKIALGDNPLHSHQLLSFINERYPEKGPSRAAFASGYVSAQRVMRNVEEALNHIHAHGGPLNADTVIAHTICLHPYEIAEEIMRYMHDKYGWKEVSCFNS